MLETISRIVQEANNMRDFKGQTQIRGIASSPGVAIGTAVVIYPLADLDAVPDRKTENIDKEIVIFENALNAVRTDVQLLSDRMATSLPAAEQALFEAYLRILDRTSLGEEVVHEIRAGHWAQSALKRVVTQHIQLFEELEDEYLRERATDLRDLGRRILSYLQAHEPHQLEYPERTILVGDEITATTLAEVPENRLVGIISVKGSSNSHIAILARALGFPAITGAASTISSHLDGQELIVDGYEGVAHVAPTANLRRAYETVFAQQREFDSELAELQELPAQTLDGHKIALYVNVGLAADVKRALTAGAEGVGLYRTEVPFMLRNRFPTEEEQRVVYQQLLRAFAPRPVMMRTLDVGGDKALPYFPIVEENPFLGWRGIRITLDYPEVFLIQVRAMLRASTGLDNLRIMLPMITTVTEVDDALRLIKQAHHEISEEGIQVVMPPVGVMIEVPSAVYLAHALAKRVDFLSVGSNDLTQYILAVDRNNTRVANLFDALNPAVLQALHQIVESGHRAGRPVSICGEMAADPLATILLLAMGFDSFSMNSPSFAQTKWVIRSFTREKAKQLLADVLKMDNSTAIRAHLTDALEKAGLKRVIRAHRLAAKSGLF